MSMWKKIRQDNNLSCQQVANMLGYSRQFVNSMENGKSKKTLTYMIFILSLRNKKEDRINIKMFMVMLTPEELKKIEKLKLNIGI